MNRKTLKLRTTIFLSILSISACFNNSFADALIPVSDVSSTSTASDSYHEVNLINESGLSGEYHDNQWENMWMGEQHELPMLTFDLGAVYSVSELKIWQYNYHHFMYLLNRGVKDFEIYGSIDGINGTLLFSEILTKSPGGQILPQTFTISTDARYIQIQIKSNYGEDFTGLSEVQFFGSPGSDSDSDGMPDSWEGLYSLNPYYDDALLDSDGDGTNNLDEYLNATNPQNIVPDPPVLLFPSHQQEGVSLTPTLKSNDCNDLDAGDTHAYTHWQISLESDFTVEQRIIINYLSDVDLTELAIPGNVLSPNTTYHCRLRYFDGAFESSEWSDTTTFTTQGDGAGGGDGGNGGGCFIGTLPRNPAALWD